MTLYSKGSGTWCHSYIVGDVGAPCESGGGGGARGVISLSSEPKPGKILDTGRGLFQNH